MNKQKPISMRIDNYVLWRVDQEAMVNKLTRNGIINAGASLYCSLQDSRRSYRMHRQNKGVAEKIVIGFLMLHFPELVTDGFDFKLDPTKSRG